jgi:xanthine dehydrogenase accessory factor
MRSASTVTRPLAIVLGSGEVGSAIAWVLDAVGMAVVLVDDVDPSWHRRGMAFTNAWYLGNAELDGKGACFCASVKSIPSVLARGMVAATTWSWPGVAEALRPVALVDARRRNRRGAEPLRGRVPASIGVGPGFSAGDDVDVAIELSAAETRLAEGGLAGSEASLSCGGSGTSEASPCIVFCARRGRFATGLRIGESVPAGRVVGAVGTETISAPRAGILVGLTARGARVEPGDELVEIHADRAVPQCYGLAEGPRRIAERVRCALAGKSPLPECRR